MREGLFKRDRITVVVALFVIAATSWVFLELADEIMEEEPLHFDRQILLALRTPDDLNDPIGPIWFEEMVRDITSLGGTVVLSLVTALVCVFLLLSEKRVDAGVLLTAAVTGALVSHSLKSFFGRARPDLVAHHTEVISLSFPSGHSMSSAVVFMTIGTIISQSQPKQRLKTFAIATAVLLTILVGSSRVYLGVHWPSDVLAGWCAGATWAFIWWIAARALTRRLGNRRSPPPPSEEGA